MFISLAQADEQIGTVNYMSPEAIQRMNNQKVLKVRHCLALVAHGSFPTLATCGRSAASFTR
jgi:hypothetical protein